MWIAVPSSRLDGRDLLSIFGGHYGRAMGDSTPSSSSELPSLPPEEKIVVVEHRIRRLGWSLVADATMGVVSMEKGFWFTLKSFALRPRQAFQSYLGEDRLRFNNPLKLVFFVSALTAFLNYQLEAFGLLDFGVGNEDLTAEAAERKEFVKRNYNLLVLGSLPIMAALGKLFYARRAYNLLEHLALNAFQLGVTTALYVALMPLIVLWPVTLLIYSIVALAYQVWVYRQVLGPGWFRAISATLAITVSYFVMMTAVSILAVG